MRALIIFGILLSLLPLAALGHDLYMAYGKDGEIDLSQPFQLSYVGWLWQTYSPDTFRITRSNFEPETWARWIRPILEQSALIITLIPPSIIFAIVLVLKIVRSGLFMLKMKTGPAASKVSKAGFAAPRLEKQKGPIKYTRK